MQRLVMHLAQGREQQTLMGVSLRRGMASADAARERMLASRQSQWGGAKLTAVVQRSGALAGDVMTFHPLESDHAGIAMLSVEGDGMGPTLVAASIHALLAPDQDQAITILEHGDGTPREPADVLGIPEEDFAVIESMRDMSEMLREETAKISSRMGQGVPQFGHANVAGVPVTMIDEAGNSMAITAVREGVGDVRVETPAGYSVRKMPTLPQIMQ